MKAKFELKTWLSENREVVIEKYNKLTGEEFFNGISLRDFMIQVMKLMTINNPKSEKRAASLLHYIIGDAYVNNSKLKVVNNLDDKMRQKYEGTAYMAMI